LEDSNSNARLPITTIFTRLSTKGGPGTYKSFSTIAKLAKRADKGQKPPTGRG